LGLKQKAKTMMIATILHLLAAVIWVGGMFFAVYMLRPAAGPLEPPERAALWVRVFARFFPWVWGAVILLPASGYFMIFNGYGGFADLPPAFNTMQAIGWLMILLFLHMYFVPYARFKRAVEAGDFPEAGKRLNQIRLFVTVNLYLGLINIAVGVAGRYVG